MDGKESQQIMLSSIFLPDDGSTNYFRNVVILITPKVTGAYEGSRVWTTLRMSHALASQSASVACCTLSVTISLHHHTSYVPEPPTHTQTEIPTCQPQSSVTSLFIRYKHIPGMKTKTLLAWISSRQSSACQCIASTFFSNLDNNNNNNIS